MPIILSPMLSGYADGYYAKRAKMLVKAGEYNVMRYTRLDSNALTIDEDVLQAAIDATDRYADGRARFFGVTADPTATSPRMIGEASVWFGRISDLASSDAIAEVYQARGRTGDNSNEAEGQMSDLRNEARKELDEILQTMIDEESGATGETNGPEIITLAYSNRACYQGPLACGGWG